MFSNRICDGKETYVFSREEADSAALGDMLLFSFTLKADTCAEVEFQVDAGTDISMKPGEEKSIRYTVPSQLSKIYMPVKNNGLKSISVSVNGSITLFEAGYENLGAATYQELMLKSGIWLADDYESYELDNSRRLNVGKTIDLVIKNGFIYSIGDGNLTVTDAENGEILSVLPCLKELRQIDITADGRYVLITGRQDGVAVVCVEDPRAPCIAASYNSVEFATGIHISGDYAFICNRQYGVEIVDISNPEKPCHVANIHSGEVQSCTVHNNILYAGVWGECGVYMYDLNDLRDTPFIEPVGFVKTNGKGDGLTVLDIGEEVYLFAATGHYRTDCAAYDSPLSNLWHGQGNGMDIYNVTDPKCAKWISGVHTDGRYYHFANDFWETDISYDENTGRYYVYLVNTYNGVYIYDITDIASPKRLMHITAPLPVSPANPPLMHNTRNIITPWDQSKERRSSVGAVGVYEGRLYIAAVDTDIFCVDIPFARYDEKSSDGARLCSIERDFYKFRNLLPPGEAGRLGEDSFRSLSTDGQTFAAAVYKDRLYVAMGSSGIRIYNKNIMEETGAVMPVEINGLSTFTYDVGISGDMLYAAEGIGGLRIYDISGNFADEPKFICSYAEGGETVRQAVISPDGLFAVLHIGCHTVRVIALTGESPGSAVVEKSFEYMLYHRQISSVIHDRYICFWVHVGIEYWLDFGPAEARYPVPEFVGNPFKGCSGMVSGPCEFIYDDGEWAVLKSNQKKRAFILTKSFDNEEGQTIAGLKNQGHPTMCGKYLAVCNRIDGTVDFYNTAGVAARTYGGFEYLGSILCAGNPDRAVSDGTNLYIPLGYQGFLAVCPEKIFSDI
ncbi:MAG: hypothetical protein IJ460_07485 [Clostridia bacterium]|nr:hypothetical protein [Clostridia bacterium]